MAAVSGRCILRHLLADTVPYVPLRMTQENHLKVQSFAQRPHTLAAVQSRAKGDHSAEESKSTGGQTTGLVYQQMPFIFCGSSKNNFSTKKIFNKLKNIPHAILKRKKIALSPCVSGSDYKDLAGKLVDVHQILQSLQGEDTCALSLLNLPAGYIVDRLTRCQGRVLFCNIFLGFGGTGNLGRADTGMLLRKRFCADNRAYERFNMDCYHTLLLISPRHRHYFKENVFQHVSPRKDVIFLPSARLPLHFHRLKWQDEQS